MKLHIVVATAFAFALSACGGGSGTNPSSTNSNSSSGNGNSGSGSGSGEGNTGGSGGTVSPTVATYTGYNYLQNLNATSAYTATFTDKGLGNAGTLSFGVMPVSITMTPDANGDGGISYGSPATAGVAIGTNSKDKNLPAIAMICQSVAGTGTGSSGKSTDVLVTSNATQIAFSFTESLCQLLGVGGSWVLQFMS